MAPLIPNNSLLSFILTKIILSTRKLVIFHLRKVLPSSVMFTSDQASIVRQGATPVNTTTVDTSTTKLTGRGFSPSWCNNKLIPKCGSGKVFDILANRFQTEIDKMDKICASIFFLILHWLIFWLFVWLIIGCNYILYLTLTLKDRCENVLTDKD